MDDRPEVRIGTAERERAQNALSAHFSEGRLDVGEFEERSGSAAAARTYGDLVPVFSDLPGGLPAALAGPSTGPDRPHRKRASGTASRRVPVAALLLLLLLLMVVSHGFAFFLLIPVTGGLQHRRRHGGPHRLDGPGYWRP